MDATGKGALGQGGGDTRRRLQSPGPRYGERAIKYVLALCGILSVAITTAIVISLIGPTIGFFQVVPIGDFIFGTEYEVPDGDDLEEPDGRPDQRDHDRRRDRHRENSAKG